MVTDHAVTIPSANNAPNPSGTPLRSDEASPTLDNPWLCDFACTVVGHTDTVQLLWNGIGFGLPDSEANDATFGRVDFTYNPPLTEG